MVFSLRTIWEEFFSIVVADVMVVVVADVMVVVVADVMLRIMVVVVGANVTLKPIIIG